MSNTLNNIVPYSVGYSLINLNLNDDILIVYPESIFPMVDGELQDSMEKYSAQFKDSFGSPQTVQVDTSIGIKAKWLCQDPNVLTPPNVRRGAKVQLWQESNTGYFYWSTLTNTDNYQKLETKIMGFSNTQNEDEKPSPENTWTQGVSTHEKKVNLIHTTKSDGEKWAYDVNIDAKNGFVNITDDIGNLFKIDSGNQIVRLQTSAGAYIEINGRDIKIGCDNLTHEVASNIKTTATNINTEASSGINTNTPSQNHVGNINLTGGLTGVPGAGGSGMTMTGDINQINGDHTVEGISFLRHVHREQGDGSDTSPPK